MNRVLFDKIRTNGKRIKRNFMRDIKFSVKFAFLRLTGESFQYLHVSKVSNMIFNNQTDYESSAEDSIRRIIPIVLKFMQIVVPITLLIGLLCYLSTSKSIKKVKSKFAFIIIVIIIFDILFLEYIKNFIQ